MGRYRHRGLPASLWLPPHVITTRPRLCVGDVVLLGGSTHCQVARVAVNSLATGQPSLLPSPPSGNRLEGNLGAALLPSFSMHPLTPSHNSHLEGLPVGAAHLPSYPPNRHAPTQAPLSAPSTLQQSSGRASCLSSPPSAARRGRRCRRRRRTLSKCCWIRCGQYGPYRPYRPYSLAHLTLDLLHVVGGAVVVGWEEAHGIVPVQLGQVQCTGTGDQWMLHGS